MRDRMALGLWVSLVLLVIPLAGAAQGIVGPSQMSLCDQATFTATVTNASATESACRIVITNAVPNAGFSVVAGTSTLTLVETSETFTVDPTDGAWNVDAIRGSAYTLPPGGEIKVPFDLATDCSAVSGNDVVTVDFENCAVPGAPLRNTHSTSIEILPGAIVISKTPSVVEASVGDEVTWTVTAENTGLGSVKNVVVTDVLGAGLEFVSASDGGGLSGGAIVWSAATTTALEEIAASDSVPLSITARVVACEYLSDGVDARWGCNAGEVCEDTAVPGSCGSTTATASIALVLALPNLVFTAPAITVPYCTLGETVTIPIENAGTGDAHNVRLCVNLAGLAVDDVQGTATYADGCFSIPLIPGSSTYSLQFHVTFAGDWCTGSPSGSPIYTLAYENDCGIEHRARPQIGSVGGSGGPSLSATKSGPTLVKLGQDLTYTVGVTYSGSPSCGTRTVGRVSVVDSVPDGFVVVSAGGGTVLPSGDIAWTFDPTVDPSFSSSVTIRVPSDCGACYTETANELSASVVDCCGCTRTASAAASIVIECDLLYTSEMTVAPEALVRCGDPATFTDTHVFANDASLDPVSFDEYQYATLPSNRLAYVPGGLTVTVDGGLATATVDDATPDGPLGVTIGRTDSVRGHMVVYTYQLEATEASTPACGGASTFYVWTSHQLGVDAPVGACGTFYDATPVSIEPPAMSVSISGIPSIQDECATYDVTLTLSRTSTNAVPYDARLVLSGLAPYAADALLAACGGVAPADGSACTAPIETADSMEWRFADAFALGDTATITLPVTVPCGGPLLALGAEAFYDDLCSNDDVYDDVCSASAGGAASLSVAADVCVQKTPEIIFATEKEVTWRLCFTNVGNGVAANTWVEDALGAGLVYVSSSISDGTGATEHPNEGRLGALANGVTWVIDELLPGEERSIELTARLVACGGMTNDVAVGWGCLGDSCQTPKTDASSVVVPTSTMVATSYLPTPINVCSSETATVTAKNAGVTATYDVAVEVTLPDGVSYAGGAEYRVGNGSWVAAPDPLGIPGPTLTWTASEIPALAIVAAREQVQVRFVVATDCAFDGGVLGFQVGYKNPCGNEFTSGVGAFSVSARVPDVAVAVRQVNPPAGDAIACDGEATWEIDVKNAGTIVVPVVRVGALLDDGLVFVDSTGDPTYGPADGGSQAGSSVAWELASLPVGATATLSLTAAAPGGGANCEALGLFVDAYWGCGLVDGASSTADAGCITSSPTTATVSGTRVPPVDAAAAVLSSGFEVCGSEGTIQVTVENTSTTVTASDLAIALSLPTDLTYIGETSAVWPEGSSTADPTGTPGPDLAWPLAATLGPGETLTLAFVAEASCYTATRTIDVDVTYLDCCGTTLTTVTASAAAPALVPSLGLSKTPATSALDCLSGEEVTWTLRVTNSGTGTADIVRLVDTLGADLVHVSGGTEVAGDPQVWGWEFGPLGPGEFEDMTLTGELSAELGGCDAVRRTNMATALWACGTPDGNPTTVGEYECSGGTVEDAAVVQVANLAVGSADIVPAFACSGDGVGSGALRVTIRNPSDAPVTQDFAVQASESTTGWSVSGTFTSLGGTLPMAANGSQTLTLPGWPVACSACLYHFAVTVDAAGQICECAEGNNTATLDYTLTVPDLSIDSAGLAVTCSADGQIRVQGPIVVRNAGCGSAYTGSIPLRVTLYDAAGCAGTVLDQFTLSLPGASVPAGGTQSFTLNRTRTLNVCGTCAVSIQLELDYANTICECDGTNNALCVGPYAVAFPDLRVSSMNLAGLTCVGDAVSGSVTVTVENVGCGAATAFYVSLVTDGCLTFATQRVTSLAASGSTTLTFPVATTWADCTDCSCTFVATVDGPGEVCECAGANNQTSSTFSLSRPDLEVRSAALSLDCAGDAAARLRGSVVLANAGCAPVTGSVGLRVTVYSEPACAGNVVETWTETLSGISLAAGGGTQTVGVDRTVAENVCAYGGCSLSAKLEVDPDGMVCECDGTDNALCAAVVSSIPDLVIALATPSVPTACSSGSVLVAVRNAGCGTVPAGVVVRVTGDASGQTQTAGPLGAGGSEIVSVTLNEVLSCGSHRLTVTVDPAGGICECDDGNNVQVVDFSVADPDGTFSDLVAACRGDDTFDIEVNLDNVGGQAQTDIAVALYVDGVRREERTQTLAAGASVSLAFETQALPCGTPHSMRVVADGADAFCECDETNNEAEVWATCPCPALVTTKTVAGIRRAATSVGTSGPVEPGDVVTYRLTVTNVGGGTAFYVGIEDTLPDPLSYVAGSASATWPRGTSTADPAGGTGPGLTFGLAATLAASEAVSLVYDARVGSDVSPNVDYVNAMSATGSEGTGAPIPADASTTVPADIDRDDQSAVSLRAVEPALVTAKSVASILRDGVTIPAASRVAPGDRVRYEVHVTNAGGGTAYAVQLVDALPNGFTYVGGSASAVWPSGASAADPLGGSGSELRFELGAQVPPGGVLTLTFEGLVTPGVDEIGPYTNVLSATGVDGNGTPIPADNSSDVPGDTDADDASDATLLPARPALVTAKSVASIVREGEPISTAGPIAPGDVVTYRLTVANVGRGTAFNVGLEDELPPPLSYVGGSATASWPGGSATADPVGVPGPSLSWPLSVALGSGEAMALEFDALVGSVLQGSAYVNAMTAVSNDATGAPTPTDRSDEAPDDTDADDASAVSLPAIIPALSVDKVIVDVHRGGVSLGAIPAAVPGDVVTYRFTIRNVGNGAAYNVDFHDELPPGFEYETAAPYGGGSYAISAPSATGGLAVPDGATSFATSMDATIDGGAQLVATYAARITDAAETGVSLENVAEAEGFNGAGVEISDANPVVGDTFDDDVEDADADDTGVAPIRVGMPALAVNKETLDIERRGVSIGAAGPVEPGDVMVYRFTIRNVGTDDAYDVGFVDLLPPGIEMEAAYGVGTFTADLPATGTTALGFADGAAGSVEALLGVHIGRGGTLTATYRVRVTGDVSQGDALVNEARALGRDVGSVPIPPANPTVGDTFDDDEDDRDADDIGTETISVVEPALVTEKIVADIVRDGASVDSATAVRPGDVITYRARVSNVGRGTAYSINIADSLPGGLVYQGPSLATWPGGSVATDPSGGTGPTLTWNLAATLKGGDDLFLTFDVRVTNDAARSATLLNVVRASGVDGSGMPIPPDNADDVPADDDADDADGVRLSVAPDVLATAMIPALVTEKSVARIVRGGETAFGTVVEPGDRVTFELVVRNVGTGTAYGVIVTDSLPPEMGCVAGTTSARWPLGVSFDDASGIPGPELEWSLLATLRAGESIRLTFEAVVAEGILDGQTLVNRMQARGEDEAGAPIPTDQSGGVPGDIDDDAASDLFLTTRSSLLQGEGGLIQAPILRKDVERLGGAPCRQAEPLGDDVWFQTDIALYASAELEWLAESAKGPEVSRETLLPTWLRDVAVEARRVGFENLVEVEVGSGMGVPLAAGPRFRDAMDAQSALEQRLNDCARAVGLDPAERPSDERWTVLEYAAGDPRFASRSAGANPWPTGEWEIYDRRITPSAVGMGLLAQALEARRLLESRLSQDRYLGCVVVEAMRNKIASLAELRAAPGSANGLLAHAYTATWSGRRVAYTVVEPRVDLIDQAALAWGLAAFVEFAELTPSPWPSTLGSLASDVRDARKELERVLDGTSRSLRGFDGALRESTADVASTAQTTTLGLLLSALSDVSRVVGAYPSLERLAAHAAIQLSGRVGLDGHLDSTMSGTDVADACAAIRGLLAASRILGVSAYETTAVRVLEAFDRGFWDDAVGAYVEESEKTGAAACLTPLDLGLVVGALRDAATVLPRGEADRVLARLASHVRAVVDSAALHLANAVPQGGAGTFVGDGTGSFAPARVFDAPLGWAFVFKDRLCYAKGAMGENPCVGLAVDERDVYYQTDWAMYAGYEIESAAEWAADYADANLTAAILHAGLGQPLEGASAWRARADAAGAATSALHPVSTPYAGGHPGLVEDTSLVWDAATFDLRRTGSALGMTLLREAQELAEFADRGLRTDSEQTSAEILLESALETLDAVGAILDAAEAELGVRYVPRAVLAERTSEAWRITVVEPQSGLFDQTALLWGLSELASLVSRPDVAPWLVAQGRSGADVGARLADATDAVLATFMLHLDSATGTLLDEIQRTSRAWILEARVDETTLALAVPALLDFTRSPLAAGRTDETQWARGLVPLLLEHLAGRASEETEGSCEIGGLTSRLAALRAFVAGYEALGDPRWEEQACAAFGRLVELDWDEESGMYRASADALSWCYTPLDLGLLLGSHARFAALLDIGRAADVETKMRSSFLRWSDAAKMQLSSLSQRRENGGGTGYAPVFDRRVCLRRVRGVVGADYARPGDLVRYRITADNPTESTWTDLVLVDALPEGLVVLDPAGPPTGATLSWPTDSLGPGETRSWAILGRIPTDAPPGVVYENCATLSYRSESGVEQKPRRACAETRLEDPPAESRKAAWWVDLPDYDTAEAMYLSAILTGMSDAGWSNEPRGLEYAFGNLATLLVDSELGLTSREVGGSPAVIGEDLAAVSGGPCGTARVLDNVVLIPFRGGKPVLGTENGFRAKDATITAAALGQTLAMEAAALRAYAAESDAWSQAMKKLVGDVVDFQLAWIDEHRVGGAGAPRYVPRSIRVVDGVPPIELVVDDGASDLYGQASLLWGLELLREARGEGETVDRLLEATFDRTIDHGLSEPGTYTALLPAGAATSAVWMDLELAARAFSQVARGSSTRSGPAAARLGDLCRAAAAAPIPTDPAEAMALLRVLLYSASLSDVSIPATAIGALWSAVRERFWLPLYGLPGDRTLPPSEWTFSPRKTAVLLDALSALTDLGLAVPGDVDRAFERIVEAGRIQLVAPPTGYGRSTLVPAPTHIAPVFGQETTVGGWRRTPIVGAPDMEDGFLLFTIDLSVPARLGPVRSLSIDCALGLVYVPGSARFENERGEWVLLDPPVSTPLRFEISRLDRAARVEYLMWWSGGEWANSIGGEWIDPSGRVVPWIP
ncbi:MAG: hypothetical protein NTY63_04495 [Candidatus Bipolaricaulota bacterium]|nr:hypothetical protein [Candidatus Bipolaricaulota bacterium]